MQMLRERVYLYIGIFCDLNATILPYFKRGDYGKFLHIKYIIKVGQQFGKSKKTETTTSE